MAVRRFLFYVLPVLLWLAVIFSLSTKAGSAAHTNSDLNRLLALFFPHFYHNLTWHQLDAMHYYLRKCAHLTEYAVLGILMLRAFRSTGVPRTPGRITRSLILISWLLCAIYAATDEYHQVFVPGRSPEVTDALLDSVGAAIGIALYCAWVRRREHRSILNLVLVQQRDISPIGSVDDTS